MTPIALSAAAETSQSSAVPGGLEIALLILVCVAVIAAAYYTTRFIARRAGGGGKSRHMQVLDRLAISNDKQIFIIKAGGKVHMLGITGQNINHLAELDEAEMDFAEPEPASPAANLVNDFAERLKASMPFGSNKTKQGSEADKPKATWRPRKAEKQKGQERSEERPIKSGLDTLEDMVSRRKNRFQAALDEAGAQQETAAAGDDRDGEAL